MRYLFTTIPGPSHMLPLVPLAHAARAAGHDVLVATSGPALRLANEAGLHAVAVDDGDSVRPYEKLRRRATEISVLAERPDAEYGSFVASVFGEVGTLMADGLVDAARRWGADVVVYPPPHVAGLLAARAIGVPAVLHGLGTPRATFGPALAHLAPVARRMGVAELREADVELDLSPPSLETPHPRAAADHRLPMRYCPYNGGAELPTWVLQRGSRPRVVATLGSLPELYGQGTLLREIVLGTEDLEIDLILTTAGTELSALPSPLPKHVTCVDWVPMRALLDTCDAVLHHGGLGTMYAAMDARVPQLSSPMPHDSVVNAQVAAARGVGSILEMSAITAATVAPAVQDLLTNPAYRRASREVAEEMRAMPAPGAVIDQLTELVAGIRG
jgi:glycosyltransferase